jgi:hypothetical protein
LLCQTVPSNGMALADALWVETHAPAAAPDPVVSLHQMGKVVPGVRTERPRHIGADWCHPSMVTSSNLALANGPVLRAHMRFEGLGFGSALLREVAPYGVHVSTVTHTYASTAHTRARQIPRRGAGMSGPREVHIGGERFGRASALSFRVLGLI